MHSSSTKVIRVELERRRLEDSVELPHSLQVTLQKLTRYRNPDNLNHSNKEEYIE